MAEIENVSRALGRRGVTQTKMVKSTSQYVTAATVKRVAGGIQLVVGDPAGKVLLSGAIVLSPAEATHLAGVLSRMAMEMAQEQARDGGPFPV